jgi:hypothetical protein
MALQSFGIYKAKDVRKQNLTLQWPQAVKHAKKEK